MICRFLQLVRLKPEIWDATHPSHVNNATSDDETNLDPVAQFTSIGQHLGISPEECFQQFEDLRQRYYEIVEGGGNTNFNWPHFDSLGFLNRVKFERDPHSHGTDDEQFVVEPSLDLEPQSFGQLLTDAYSYSDEHLTEEDYTMDQGFNWSQEYDEKLIEFVRNCPPLWQTDHKDFVASPGIVSVDKARDRFTKRFKFLVPIARDLGTTAAECEHHFSILRVQYVKATRPIDNSKQADQTPRKPFPLLEKMNFLEGVITRRATHSKTRPKKRPYDDGFGDYDYGNSSASDVGFMQHGIFDPMVGAMNGHGNNSVIEMETDSFSAGVKFLELDLMKMEQKKADFCLDKVMLAFLNAKATYNDLE